MKIVTVIPLKKGMFREDLTYFTTKEVENGSVVIISIRNKQTIGLVISVESLSELKSDIKKLDFNLKKIIEVKEKSIFLKELIESIFLVGKYFVSKNNYSMTSLIPSIVRDEYDKISQYSKNKDSLPVNVNNLPSNVKTEKFLFQAQIKDRLSFYKTLIRASFAQKKSVFIILPTEKDINEFSGTLEKGIENFTIIMHGGLGSKKQLKNIKQIIESDHPLLIIGTAPYLSIPRNDIGTIILEHENSNAYKMIAKPNFDLRTYVEIFASKIKAKLIFGDFLLRYETIARKDIDSFSEVLTMSYRNNFNGEIETSGKEDKFKILTDKTVKEIHNSILKNENIFIFSLRKGLATMTVCRNCNEPVMCGDCSAPLVLYISRDQKKRMFICNRCKKEENTETTCSNCKSWDLVPLGIGTETVYQEVKKFFPEVKVFKIDKESVKTNTIAEKIIKEFEESKGSILIGTEMTFFYMRNKVALSVISSFDSLWSIPNFKMSERIVQLMVSIISRTERKFLIQTKNENDRAIISTINENLFSFIKEELTDRKKLGYPPYMRFIKINHLGDKEESVNAKNILYDIFKDYKPEIFSGFIAKEKGKYSTNALIKINTKEWSLSEISIGSEIKEDLFKKLISLPLIFSITIDPEDLL